MIMRTYGTAKLIGSNWCLEVEPHVSMMMKRVFPSLRSSFRQMKLSNTASNCELLEWAMVRYPLTMSEGDRVRLSVAAETYRQERLEGEEILKSGAAALDVKTKIQLRDYQRQAVALLQIRSFLCGDDLGLGKTAIGLGAIATGQQPAIVVCQTHLQKQWVAETELFIEGAKCHIVKKTAAYDLPEHNILILPYSKLASWTERLSGYRLAIFDEAQELRRPDSLKYKAAAHLCSAVDRVIGLTATPIYNYGDEIYSVVSLLAPDALGSRDEFIAEWCESIGVGRYKVKDPQALGSFLAESQLFLRRRRSEVGRELPPVLKIAEEVEYNKAALDRLNDRALQLAKSVMSGSFTESGRSALELDSLMRQQTGLSKAPFVADFVRQLVESGESVVLAGWHREVYTVWQSELRKHGIPFVMYTGSETPNQKDKSVRAFMDGEAQVFILSLRSGAGLNGLQRRSNLVVFGELDWSPQVHDQLIGRLNRDGQESQVTAIYLYSSGGSDPIVMRTLGIKKNQSEGIINPGQTPAVTVTDKQAVESRVKALAVSIIKGMKDE